MYFCLTLSEGDVLHFSNEEMWEPLGKGGLQFCASYESEWRRKMNLLYGQSSITPSQALPLCQLEDDKYAEEGIRPII